MPGAFDDGGLGSGVGTDYFPDPFCDYASTVMPKTILDAHRFCELVYNTNGAYREAARRTLAFFITQIKIQSADDKKSLGAEEKSKYELFFRDVIEMIYQLHASGMDLSCYGNSITTLVVPFRRFLRCPECRAEHPLRIVMTGREFKFRWQQFRFHAHCPQCDYTGRWQRVDRRQGDPKGFKIKRFRPQDIEIRQAPYSESCEYIWRIPEDDRHQIIRGDIQVLEDTPWSIIEAVAANDHYLFDPGVIYHMKEPPLAGNRMRGWGVSRVLSNFRQTWYVQVLHRFNEAIALDYIVPMRVITPASKEGSIPEGGDPLMALDMDDWRSQVESMIAARRVDPARWNFLPFPIQYQLVGGEARQLVPYELLDQGVSLMLNNAGFPVEFFKGSLTTQTAYPAVRLFESSWAYLVSALNGFLRFYSRRIGEELGWEEVIATLTPPTVADDIQAAQLKLQLAQQRSISQTTALAAVGEDFKDEQRQIISEELFISEEQQKAQDEAQQSALMSSMSQPPQPQQQGGAGVLGASAGAPGGGDPSAGGGGPAPGSPASSVASQQPTQPNVPQTPQSMLAKAEELANQFLAQPETDRQKNLTELKRSDPSIHAFVTQKLRDLRERARSIGGAQVMQQQYGGGQQ